MTSMATNFDFIAPALSSGEKSCADVWAERYPSTTQSSAQHERTSATSSGPCYCPYDQKGVDVGETARQEANDITKFLFEAETQGTPSVHTAGSCRASQPSEGGRRSG